jgi:hypothetical protein
LLIHLTIDWEAVIRLRHNERAFVDIEFVVISDPSTSAAPARPAAERGFAGSACCSGAGVQSVFVAVNYAPLAGPAPARRAAETPGK